MSEVKVNKVSPRSGTTVTIGDSGDTINLVGTLQNNGSPLTGDISSVVAGTGLSGGATSGVATLNIEAAQPTITSLGTITSFTSTGIDDNADATAITIDSSENVGIKNTTPSNFNASARQLVVGNGSGDNGITIFAGNTNNSSLFLADGTTATNGYRGSINYLHNGDALTLHANATETMRLSNGKVGIGTSSPSQKLHVYNASSGSSYGTDGADLFIIENNDSLRIDLRTTSSNTAGIMFSDSVRNVGALQYSHSSDSMSFRTNNGTRMTIDSSGNVGIGVAPSAFSSSWNINALQVTDVTSLYSMGVSTGDRRTILGNNLFIGTDNNRKFVTAGAQQSFLQLAEGSITYNATTSTGTAGGNSSATERFRIDGDGGITTAAAGGTCLFLKNFDATDPYGILQIFYGASPDNNTQYFFKGVDSTADRIFIYADGDLANHDGVYGSISDERIKQDIRDSNSQWNDIKAVRVRNFKKKDDVRQYGENAWEQIGVVAQELETVSPKLIKHTDPSKSDILSDSSFGTLYQEGDVIPEGKEIGDVKEINEQVKKVSYSVLYMKSIKALQEAMERIETLEAKVTTLENA